MMQSYIGCKVVQAEPMTMGVAAVRGLVRMKPGTGPTEGHGVTMLAVGTPDAPGYKVVYEDGYVSWSPAEVFERCYRVVTPAEAGLILG